MELLSEDVRAVLPKLYATEAVPLADKRVVVKFFTPDAGATWFIVEGEPRDDGDFIFFGYANLGDPDMAEWGYVTLSQLREVRGRLGLPVERDLHFGTPFVRDVPEIKL